MRREAAVRLENHGISLEALFSLAKKIIVCTLKCLSKGASKKQGPKSLDSVCCEMMQAAGTPGDGVAESISCEVGR
jgi:hypothetical protein